MEQRGPAQRILNKFILKGSIGQTTYGDAGEIQLAIDAYISSQFTLNQNTKPSTSNQQILTFNPLLQQFRRKRKGNQTISM